MCPGLWRLSHVADGSCFIQPHSRLQMSSTADSTAISRETLAGAMVDSCASRHAAMAAGPAGPQGGRKSARPFLRVQSCPPQSGFLTKLPRKPRSCSISPASRRVCRCCSASFRTGLDFSGKRLLILPNRRPMAAMNIKPVPGRDHFLRIGIRFGLGSCVASVMSVLSCDSLCG